MLNRFIPSEEIRLSRAKTDDTQGLVNYPERKENLKENFNYDWVQKMPLDMVREFHKHLDYESRTMELLDKHPFIMSTVDTTLADIFTATQLEKIFQEGFVKKLVETTGNLRKCRSEVVNLLPKQQTTCYIDLQGRMKSHTPVRHPVLFDLMKFIRSSHIFRNSRPNRQAIRCLMKTTTFIAPFDNFLRRTAYQLVSSIIIYKDTVMNARIQRENALKLKAEERRQAAILKSEARIQAAEIRLNARIEARNAVRRAKVEIAKKAKAERKAERDAMILAEKETKLSIHTAKKAAKVQEKEAAKAAKVQEKEAAKAAKAQEQEAAKAAKAQEQEAAKAAKAQEQEAAKAAKAAEKEAAKAAKVQEKEAAKASKAQEKEAAKASKMQEKEAAKAAKAQEKEATKAAKAQEKIAKAV